MRSRLPVFAFALAALISDPSRAQVSSNDFGQAVSTDPAVTFKVTTSPPDAASLGGPHMTSSFISRNVKLIMCPDFDSTIGMLDSIESSEPSRSEIKANRCRNTRKHIKITGLWRPRDIVLPGGSEVRYLAFSGEDWTPQKGLPEIYGVVNVTANHTVAFTEFERWQHIFTPSDGSLHGSGRHRNVLVCPNTGTAVKLIKGRRSAEKKRPNQRQKQRLEVRYETCAPASGRFEPFAMLESWKHNGWAWTAFEAKDERGKVVGILHEDVAPKYSEQVVK